MALQGYKSKSGFGGINYDYLGDLPKVEYGTDKTGEDFTYGGSSDRGDSGGGAASGGYDPYGINRYSGVGPLTFANPDKQNVWMQQRQNSNDVSRLNAPVIPSNLDLYNTIYDAESGEFVPHEYPKIPGILGSSALSNTLLYGRPSGSDHLSPTQVSNIHNAAATNQAYSAAAWDALSDSGGTEALMHYKHTDKDGNWSIIDPVQELAQMYETGWDMKGNYHPHLSAAVASHAADMAAIPSYGAHEGGDHSSSSSSGGSDSGFDPFEAHNNAIAALTNNSSSSNDFGASGFANEFSGWGGSGSTDTSSTDSWNDSNSWFNKGGQVSGGK